MAEPDENKNDQTIIKKPDDPTPATGTTGAETTVAAPETPTATPQTPPGGASITGKQQKPTTTQTAPSEPEDIRMSSQFVPIDPIKATQSALGVPSLDPHLQEMLRDAKARTVSSKLREGVQIDVNGTSIFAGKYNGNDVISMTAGKKIDAEGAKVMVAMAKNKGWGTVYATPSTSNKEKEALWLEAQRQGLHMANFTPKPDSDVAKTWKEEFEARRPNAGLTPAQNDPAAVSQADPQVETLKFLRDKYNTTNDDPQLKQAIGGMYEKLRTGDVHADPATLKAVTDAFSNKNTGREGFNIAADALNKADPKFGIQALDPNPAPVTATQQGPKTQVAARTSP